MAPSVPWSWALAHCLESLIGRWESGKPGDSRGTQRDHSMMLHPLLGRRHISASISRERQSPPPEKLAVSFFSELCGKSQDCLWRANKHLPLNAILLIIAIAEM